MDSMPNAGGVLLAVCGRIVRSVSSRCINLAASAGRVPVRRHTTSAVQCAVRAPRVPCLCQPCQTLRSSSTDDKSLDQSTPPRGTAVCLERPTAERSAVRSFSTFFEVGCVLSHRVRFFLSNLC